MTRAPRDAFRDAITIWEGGFQAHPDDPGNIVGRRLIGTKFGVTPPTLARHRGVSPETITRETIMALTLDEAIDIYHALYSVSPGFDRLAWSPPVEVLCDIGWLSGPGRAVTALQRLAGAEPDGVIGPETEAAFAVWRAALGDAGACDRLADWRTAFHRELAQSRPANRAFLRGWLNRANWYRPGNAEWWRRWADAAEPPPPPPRAPGMASRSVRRLARLIGARS